jgi:hypothetical protein
MERNRDCVAFVPDAVDLASAHSQYVTDAEHFSPDLLQFGVASAAAIVDALEELILLLAVNTHNDGPCAVIVRRGSSMGQPAHGKDGQTVVSFLVEKINPKALLRVGDVETLLKP